MKRGVIVNIENIQKALLECYSKDLCYPKVQDDWNDNNKYLPLLPAYPQRQ